MSTNNGITPFSKPEARTETERAKRMTVDFARQLLRLRQHNAHEVLGYKTWTEYVEKEFGRTYRRAKHLIDFANILQEIEERTGVTNPPLGEKDLRGRTPEEVDAMVDAARTAEANGEDPASALGAAGKTPRKRAPRTPGSAPATGKGKGTTGTPDTTGTIGSIPSGLEATDASGASGATGTTEPPPADEDSGSDVPENDDASTPTNIPVKQWTYNTWMELTLACPDREGLQEMKDHVNTLFEKIELRIRMAESAHEFQQSA